MSNYVTYQALLEASYAYIIFSDAGVLEISFKFQHNDLHKKIKGLVVELIRQHVPGHETDNRHVKQLRWATYRFASAAVALPAAGFAETASVCPSVPQRL